MIRIYVESIVGKRPLDVYPSFDIWDIKKLIQDKEYVPIAIQHLFYKGQLLKNDTTLQEYQITTESTIFLKTNYGRDIKPTKPLTESTTIYDDLANIPLLVPITDSKHKGQAVSSTKILQQSFRYGKDVYEPKLSGDYQGQGNPVCDLQKVIAATATLRNERLDRLKKKDQSKPLVKVGPNFFSFDTEETQEKKEESDELESPSIHPYTISKEELF